MLNFDGLIGVKPIYVTENKKLKTSISQNSIIFENIGNVDYDGIVSFSLNNGSFNETFYLNVSIDVGEEYVHNLGYSGDYNLTLDGKDFGPVHLTGYSILGNKPLEKEDYFFFAGILLFLVAVLFFTFRKKRCKEKNKKQKEIKKISQIPNKNLNKKNFQKNIPIKSYYILFLESEISNSKYRMIIEKYGFKLNSLSENLGYVLISNPSFSNPELKLYNLAKGIQKFSEIKSSKVSIVLNKGRFESKMSLLKKFALLTRKLLNYSDGKIAMTKKYFLSLGISSPKEIKKVNFMQRDLHLYYF